MVTRGGGGKGYVGSGRRLRRDDEDGGAVVKRGGGYMRAGKWKVGGDRGEVAGGEGRGYSWRREEGGT